MAATDFYKLKDKNDSLLLAALNIAVLLAPVSIDFPAALIAGGKLQELPAGWYSVGEIEKKAGVDLAPDIKVSGPEGYGSRGRRRDFITEEGFQIDFTAQETRLKTLEMFYDLEPTASGKKDFDTTTGYFAKKARASRVREYKALLIGYDGATGTEIYPYWQFPKVTLEKKGKQSLSDSDVLTYPMTLTAKEDAEYGGLFGFGITGPGFTKELATAMGMSTPG